MWSPLCSRQVFQHFRSAWIPLEKNSFGWECSHSCTACCTSLSDLKDLPPITSLRHESNWRRGLVSTTDVKDNRTHLWLLQQLNGQYAAKNCHVGAKHLYSDVHIIWTWLQDAGDSLGDLHMLHWSQCSPWACGAPKLPLVHPKRQHNLSHRRLCAEFFRFWWGGMAPFFARFLGFQLVVVDPGFTSHNNSS